jgi:hypothetical protein
MIDRATARDLAANEAPDWAEIDDTGVQELRTGWFFPYRCTDPDPDSWPLGGPGGVIINKQTGYRFFPAFPLERGLAFYDKGYQFHVYALVITKIVNLDRTLDTLERLHISTVEPSYEHGTVWRIARPLSRAELRSRISRLPYVFDGVNLYHRIEDLEQARENGFFQFVLEGCA